MKPMNSLKASERPSVVGVNLRRYREARGMSQSALAKQANLNRSTIKRIEDTGKNYSHDSLVDTAEALGINPGTLFQDPRKPLNWQDPTPLQLIMRFELRQDVDNSLILDTFYALPEEGGLIFTDDRLSQNAFAFFSLDRGLTPRINRGDLVIVEPDDVIEQDCLVLAAVYDPRTKKTDTIARFLAGQPDGKYKLIPRHPNYETVSAGPNVFLLGRIIEIRRVLPRPHYADFAQDVTQQTG